MKLKYRLLELERERDRYLDYMRCDQSIGRKDLIKICVEIGRLERIIESIKDLTLGQGEIDDNTYTYEIPSELNKIETIHRWNRKTIKYPAIPSNWDRTL